jgi:YD repeat-containing protein
MDGLGRAIKVETTAGGIVETVVDTEYGPCGGCSPLGKVKRVSQPYKTGSPAWTVYEYDFAGRTRLVTHADGVSRTTHVYSGNTTTITDPAGKWKKYTSDAFGQLVKVTEPDPLHGNVDTNYTYDTLGRLTVVSMPRGAVTQTRTFTYDGSSQRLLSATNPENGTVSYGYKKKVPDGYGGYTLVFDGLLHTKTDAKGQKVEYDYDLYGRLIRIRRFPNAQGAEDLCQGTVFYYDMNPYGYDPSHNTWGRVAVAEWGGTACAGGLFRESYTYNTAGQKTGKTLQVWRMFEGQVRSAYLSAAWTYDNWGRVQTVRFPGYYKESGSGYAEWSNGAQRQYTYNAMGQLTQLIENGMARIALAEYHPGGQLKRLDYND